MDPGSWPPPPRPDLPPPRSDLGGARSAREPSRRGRRAIVVVVAALVAASLLATAIGAVGGGSVARVALDGGGEYRFLRRLPDGEPYRWDPCVPVHYQVDLANAPPGALEDVRGALARVTSASGFHFVFDGTTDRTADTQIGRAFQSTIPGDPRWLPLLFAWVPHEHFDFLADTSRAAAFAMPKTGDGADFATYESGVVAVDAGGRLPLGFDARYSLGVVLMHEMGHVMGLAHVRSAEELMWSPNVPGADRAPDLELDDWGPGDREGLRILGEHAPCPAN